MQRLREQRLWDRMRKNVSQFGIHLERIENSAGTGMPDVLAICNGIVTWIELKAVEEFPARETTPLLGKSKGLNQAQKNWHKNWDRCGGNSLIVIGVGSLKFFAINGSCCDSINEMTSEEFLCCTHAIGYGSWKALAEYLGANIEDRLINRIKDEL
jgi:hypothetical protein